MSMNVFDLRKFENKKDYIFKKCNECGGKSIIGIEFHYEIELNNLNLMIDSKEK